MKQQHQRLRALLLFLFFSGCMMSTHAQITISPGIGKLENAAAKLKDKIGTLSTMAATLTSPSNLANPNYGFDFVVATTQAGINVSMRDYLNSAAMPEVKVCYVADDAGKPVEIACADLINLAKGTDPFSVPANADPATDPGLQNLFKARFMAGFKAKIGLPLDAAGHTYGGNIVDLGNNTASVTYHLICSEFTVVEYKPADAYANASWLNESQPAGAPWIFTSKVDLRLSTTDQSAYADLPEDVQNQIKNMSGSAFSVQQLLFDFDNASLQTVPTISGVEKDSTLDVVLSKYFIGAYFTSLQANGQPVLGCTVTQSTVPPASLTLTDFNLSVNPFIGSNGQAVASPTSDQKNLATLNYLCAANNNALPAPKQFPWNWVNPGETDTYHGVISINAHTFANWLSATLSPALKSVCSQPSCKCKCNMSGCTYTLSFQNEPNNQYYTVLATPQVGSDGFAKILTFAYSEGCSSDSNYAWNWGNISCTYSVSSDAYVFANQIKVVTTVTAHIHINVEGGVTSGNFAKYTSTDLFTLGVDNQGKMQSTYTTTTVDQSDKINYNAWSEFVSLGTVENVIDGEQDLAKSSVTSFLKNYNNKLTSALNGPQGWVFPGGESFRYKDVWFSTYQDLVSHIVYQNP